ncbi:digeranylgeranylglycerophospholipid reductase [Halopenitus persicus]|uniref:Digeranylgeranylglycerophospholipid reductase n=1 Tax=Halopenitus persicus TaxID=1048396 RepID=A0A1H3IM93_9EURY|nr:digeranylgeranylglycerophospholipid reductase [Halopenitus persicus]SDY28399.1 digeranylgeranylglycerophospholipid reductase [Halopenitus persicus]
MSDRFDVVIAGAGPAGAQCARDLAARDYDVLVLETEPEAEFPRQSNKSTAGTFPSMMAAFGVPDDVVMQFTDSVVLESPNDFYVQNQPGAVLEFAEFKRWLVADGRDRGAEYRFDSRATAPIESDGSVVGLRYDGSEEVFADVVVDATGPAAPLAKALDVCELHRENQAIGIEWELEGIDVDHPGYADLHDSMMLRLDHDVAPGGYSWIFHTGGDTAKVGLCYIQNDRHREHADEDLTIDGYLERWLESDPRFADAEKIDGKVHRGSAHIQLPTGMSTDGFVAIGDTVPSIDPLWGEGIHKGMKSARAAAAAIDRCLSPAEPDTSAEQLSTYDDLWHREVAPKARQRLLMTELLYLASNDRYDRLMRDLQSTEEDTLARINGGDLTAFPKLLHLDDLSLLAAFGKERFLEGSVRWTGGA